MQSIKIVIISIVLFVATTMAYASNKFAQNYESGYVQVEHGELFYQSYGQGFPIIVVHGGPGLNQTYLQPQLFKLAKKFRVIFYDQRGSGNSLNTVMDSTYINTNQFVNDLEKLRQHLGLKRFILLGHSWGGMLGMEYTVNYPQHVSGLILSNTGPANLKGYMAFANNLNKKIEPFKDELEPLFNRDKFEKLNVVQIKKLYRLVFSVYFYDAKKVNQLSFDFTEKSAKMGNQVSELLTVELLSGYDLLPQLRQLNVPTLIIHGDTDIVPLWTAEEISNAIPNSQLVVLKKSGHFPFIEQPQPFFLYIFQFLNSEQVKRRTR